MTRHIAIAVEANPTASEIPELRIDLPEIEPPGPSHDRDGYRVRLHPVIMNSPLVDIEQSAGEARGEPDKPVWIRAYSPGNR